jgi:hypothetical protein
MTTRIDRFASPAAVGGHARRTRVLPGRGLETTVAEAEKKFNSWVSAGPAPSGLGD